ncbi:hypothetical protein [Streptococcus hyovaginalis]|uniref:hypothetical protein n=1 Tax=Streptococcus hyovaginalis TaxID=149015 RepID=UPI003BF77BE1
MSGTLKNRLKKLKKIASEAERYIIILTSPDYSQTIKLQYKREGNQNFRTKVFHDVKEVEEFLDFLGISEDSEITNLCFGEWDIE